MAVAVRSSSKVSRASANTLSVTAPAGATTGDVVIIWATWNSVCTLSDGGQGFTKDRQDDEAGSASSAAVFSKRLTGSEGATYAINSTATDRCGAIAVCFSGPDPSTIFDYTPDATSANSGATLSTPFDFTSDAITTTADNSIHCAVAQADASGADIDAAPAGYTEQQRVTAECNLSVCTKAITPAGSTGAQTFSSTADAGWITQSFSIKNPAPVILMMYSTPGTCRPAIFSPGVAR